MIARPQADLLNMLPVTQVTPLAAKALEAGVPRFDAALLEAAKMVRDGAPEKPEVTLNPKVRQAFEAALGQLSQKPLDQLKSLAQQPLAARTEINAVVEATTQSLGLNKEEAAALKQLVPLALPSVLAFKVQAQVPGTPVDSKRVDGVQPGPQGGTPVRAASPADLIHDPKAGLQPRPELSPTPANERPQEAQSPIVALAQAVAPPVLVSTRTDDGSAKQGAVTLSRNIGEAAPAAAPNPVPQAPARVIQVLASQKPEGGIPTPAAPAPAATPSPAVPRAQVAAPAPQGVQTQAPSSVRPDAAAPQTIAAPAPTRGQGLQGPQAPSNPLPVRTGEAGVVPQNPMPEKGIAPRPDAPAPAGNAPVAPMDYQVLDPRGSVPVQAGSEVTLKEDGTWVLPKSEAPAAKQGAPIQTNGTPPSAPEATFGRPVAASLPNSVPASTPPQAATPAPANVPAAPPTAVPTTVPVAPQPQAMPVAASVPVQAPPADPNVAAAPKPEGAPSPVFATNLREQAPVTAAQRRSDDGVFNGLGRQGQDPMTALALQAARDYSVRESVFKQVSEALREAPDKESGRLLIRLKPAELGEVTVDLILRDGKLSARLVASQGEVRDAFVRDLQAFKAGLESQGVVVRDVSVAVRAGVADQQQQQAPQQQAPWWRDLPPQNSTPVLSQPALAGFNAGSTDNRFSALA